MRPKMHYRVLTQVYVIGYKYKTKEKPYALQLLNTIKFERTENK